MKLGNRKSWKLIIGVSFLFALLIAFGLLTSLWVLLVLLLPFLYVAFFIIRVQVVRAIQLSRKGYFSGRRVRNEWVYEERHGKAVASLSLRVENTEPGHYEMFIPSDQQWRASVPSWAQDRRDEIARRVAEGWRPSDFHLPEDLKRA